MTFPALDASITFDVAAVTTAAGATAGAVIGAWAMRRKTIADAKKVEAEAKKVEADAEKIEADANAVALEAAMSMIKRLEAEIRKQSFRMDSMEEELAVERARGEEMRLKYLGALNRIAELERKVAEQQAELKAVKR